MTELDEMIERAKVPAGASPAELRSWANRTARSMAARIEPLITEALLAHATAARPVPDGDAAAERVAQSPRELPRVHAARGLLRAPAAPPARPHFPGKLYRADDDPYGHA